SIMSNHVNPVKKTLPVFLRLGVAAAVDLCHILDQQHILFELHVESRQWRMRINVGMHLPAYHVMTHLR
ncbi:MAG: hypothetical protein NTV22_08545, partial [bacterium]|nr:hypothetical protein [bacterium]